MWYQATYQFPVEEGSKLAKNVVLIDCDLFSEVEQKVIEEDPTRDVTEIHRTKYREVVNFDGREMWFKVVLTDIYTDDNGKEKEIKYDILVNAIDVDDANTIVQKYVQQGYGMKVASISKSKISRVIE